MLAEIARAPHPVGSAEHDRVRGVIERELRSVGVDVTTQHGSVAGVTLRNVLVAIPGSAPTGTLLCCAHYDSVRRGAGASDDGAGVVTWIEVLRTLRARQWQPKNDVLVLFTDGEELGLLGARLFAETDARLSSIRTVVNLEAIGNGGPALLFQLGPDDGPRVAAFADSVKRPAGSSLAESIYRRMPNDTDLSVFLRRGITGFNLALTSGATAYHSPHDTAENLDPRSSQHMGDCALALTEELSSRDLRTLQGGDATFYDVLGLAVVRHPLVWDYALAAFACVGTVLTLRRLRASARIMVLECLRHAASVVLTTGSVTAAWWAIDRVVSGFAPPPAWVPGNTTSGALLFAGCVMGSVTAAIPGPRAHGDSTVRAGAAMILWSGSACAAIALLRGGAHVFYWPVIFVAFARCLPGGSAGRAFARVAVAALPLFLCLHTLHTVVQLAQRVPLVAVAVAGATAASAAQLYLGDLAALRRSYPRVKCVGLLGAAASIVASVVVARCLEWRCGALWP